MDPQQPQHHQLLVRDSSSPTIHSPRSPNMSNPFALNSPRGQTRLLQPTLAHPLPEIICSPKHAQREIVAAHVVQDSSGATTPPTMARAIGYLPSSPLMDYSLSPILSGGSSSGGSPTPGTTSLRRGRGRGRGRVKNRKKHNEAEMRRRRKLNDSFSELASMCGASKAQKAAVLKAAIARVRTLEKSIAVVTARINEMMQGEEPSDKEPLLKIEDPELPHLDEVMKTEPVVKEQPKSETSTSPPTTSTSTVSVSTSTSITSVSTATSTTSTPSTTSSTSTSTQTTPATTSEITMKETEPIKPEKSSGEENRPSHAHAIPGALGFQSWKDIQELVEYKKKTSHLISTVLQLAQLHINHQSIFTSSTVAELLCSMNGKILDCNPLFCQLFGYTKQQLVDSSLTLFALTSPECTSTSYVILQSLVAGSTQLQQVTKRYITKDKKIITCRATCWISQNEDQSPRYYREILQPTATLPSPSHPLTAHLPFTMQPGMLPFG